MVNYWLMAFKKYAEFSGRARRSEYWYYALMNFIIMMGVYVLFIACIIGGVGILAGVFGFVVLAFVLATIIPSLAVLVRRLHDTGKSGWFYFVSFIPIAGPIWLLVLLVTDSQQGDNEYGPNPKTGSQIDLINTIK